LVRAASGLVVRPAFHNKNLCGIIKTPALTLAGVHTKVRRDGYHRSSIPPR